MGWPQEIGGWKEKGAGERARRKRRERDRHRERGGIEGKKIKQIGMQHTTTGGWNEGGVKLGQLGVPTSGERVGSILSLSLVFFYTYVDTHTRTSAQTRELYLHRCSPAFLLFLSSLLLFFLPHRLRAAACGKSRNTRFETKCEI